MKFSWAELEAMSNRDLDAAVARTVFATAGTPERYSTTWQGAGLILDRMRELGWKTEMNVLPDLVGVTFERQGTVGLGKAPIAPRAIAIAAVMACGGGAVS